MELSDDERDHFAALAWFEPDPALPGFKNMRPLSLASRQALRMMGSPLFSENAELSTLNSEHERAHLAVYAWLHTAPLADITACLWDGTWVALANAGAQATDADLSAFRMYRDRTLKAVAASRVAIRPRDGTDSTPGDVVGPVDLAFKLSLVTRGSARTAGELRSLLWHVWLPQALQLVHADLRWNGSWTIVPGRETSAADFTPEATTPEWMQGQAFTAPAPS